MANVENKFTEHLTKILKDDGNEWVSIAFYDNNVNEVPIKDATVLSITTIKDGYYEIDVNLRLPKKKLVTCEYVMSKINNDKVYQSFADKFKRILDETDLKDSFNVYATTYGIGLYNIYNRTKQETQNKIETLLNELGIKYTTEYSDANWVFRFKISKSVENIERIKTL